MFLNLKRQYAEITFNEDLLLMPPEVCGKKKMIPCIPGPASRIFCSSRKQQLSISNCLDSEVNLLPPPFAKTTLTPISRSSATQATRAVSRSHKSQRSGESGVSEMLRARRAQRMCPENCCRLPGARCRRPPASALPSILSTQTCSGKNARPADSSPLTGESTGRQAIARETKKVTRSLNSATSLGPATHFEAERMKKREQTMERERTAGPVRAWRPVAEFCDVSGAVLVEANHKALVDFSAWTTD